MWKIAILDDYQNVAMTMADWTPVSQRTEISVFTDHLSDPDIGFTDDLYRTFYGDAAASIASWLDEQSPHVNR